MYKIKDLSKIYSLICQMEAIKAEIEAMKADNIERQSNGEALAWPGKMFQEAANSLSNIAKELDKI